MISKPKIFKIKKSFNKFKNIPENKKKSVGVELCFVYDVGSQLPVKKTNQNNEKISHPNELFQKIDIIESPNKEIAQKQLFILKKNEDHKDLFSKINFSKVEEGISNIGNTCYM
jgi:hypothetical protein